MPGGLQASALSHVCRTVARRAERRLYDMNKDYLVDSNIVVFINRLSDYFFVFSRYLNFISNIKEIQWKKSDL